MAADRPSFDFLFLHSHTALLRLGILNQLHDLDRLRLQFLRLSLNFGCIRVCSRIGLIEDIIVGQDDLVDNLSELFLRFPDFDLVVGGCDELVACNDDLERSERAVLVEYNMDEKKRERGYDNGASGSFLTLTCAVGWELKRGKRLTSPAAFLRSA